MSPLTSREKHVLILNCTPLAGCSSVPTGERGHEVHFMENPGACVLNYMSNQATSCCSDSHN